MNLFVITSYPQQGKIHADKTVGGASYAKLLLTALHKYDPEINITVLAEKLESEKSSYTEDGIHVLRVWERNKPFSLFSLTSHVNKPKSAVLLSYEAYMFGNPLFSFIPLFSLMLLRFTTNTQIFVLLHQVITDFSKLYAGLRKTILQTLTRFLYTFIDLSSTHMIVFETELKNRLKNKKKIVVIPHIVSEVKQLQKDVSRTRLGLEQNKTYALCFGYLAPYKGLESLVSLWPKDSGSPVLILAGGINPNHAGNPKMKEYVQELHEKSRANPNIMTTGFVSENDIPLYYSATDAVIVPYTMFLASSGPLALAISYGKPLLLSEELAPYTKTDDIAKALRDAKMDTRDLVFKKTTEDLNESLKRVLKNKEKENGFTDAIAASRSEKTIALAFSDLFHNAL